MKQQGPILRQAVESILRKREMIFWINKGKGSFTVRADSGIELEFDDPSRCQDTKILLQPLKDNVHIDLRKIRQKQLQPSQTHTPEKAMSLCFPLAIEVAEDDRLMEQVKTASLKEAQYMDSCTAKEISEIKRAIKISELEQNDTYSNDEDVKLLEYALTLSAAEANVGRGNIMQLSENEKIQTAIQRSLEGTDYIELSSKLEEDLKIAVKESLIQTTMERELEQVEMYESIKLVESLKKTC